MLNSVTVDRKTQLIVSWLRKIFGTNVFISVFFKGSNMKYDRGLVRKTLVNKM